MGGRLVLPVFGIATATVGICSCTGDQLPSSGLRDGWEAARLKLVPRWLGKPRGVTVCHVVGILTASIDRRWPVRGGQGAS